MVCWREWDLISFTTRRLGARRCIPSQCRPVNYNFPFISTSVSLVYVFVSSVLILWLNSCISTSLQFGLVLGNSKPQRDSVNQKYETLHVSLFSSVFFLIPKVSCSMQWAGTTRTVEGGSRGFFHCLLAWPHLNTRGCRESNALVFTSVAVSWYLRDCQMVVSVRYHWEKQILIFMVNSNKSSTWPLKCLWTIGLMPKNLSMQDNLVIRHLPAHLWWWYLEQCVLWEARDFSYQIH